MSRLGSTENTGRRGEQVGHGAADLDELHGQGAEGHARNGPTQSRGRRHGQGQRKRPSIARWKARILFSRKRPAGTGSDRSGSADHGGREESVVLIRSASSADASRRGLPSATRPPASLAA